MLEATQDRSKDRRIAPVGQAKSPIPGQVKIPHLTGV